MIDNIDLNEIYGKNTDSVLKEIIEKINEMILYVDKLQTDLDKEIKRLENEKQSYKI